MVYRFFLSKTVKYNSFQIGRKSNEPGSMPRVWCGEGVVTCAVLIFIHLYYVNIKYYGGQGRPRATKSLRKELNL